MLPADYEIAALTAMRAQLEEVTAKRNLLARVIAGGIGKGNEG